MLAFALTSLWFDFFVYLNPLRLLFYKRLHANEKTMFQIGKKKNNRKISRMPEDESRVHINAVTQSIDKEVEAKNYPSHYNWCVWLAFRSFNFVLIAVSHFFCFHVSSARCRIVCIYSFICVSISRGSLSARLDAMHNDDDDG